jgi:hypothetical protein
MPRLIACSLPPESGRKHDPALGPYFGKTPLRKLLPPKAEQLELSVAIAWDELKQQHLKLG